MLENCLDLREQLIGLKDKKLNKMVNIKAIVTIDRNNVVVTHKSWADLQHWELSQAATQALKTQLSDKIREFIRRSRNLEDQYHLPRGSLEGIHLITGSSVELARKLHRPEITELLTKPENIFIIKIRQGDPIIRTTIHTPTRVVEWEYFNDDATLLNWRNLRLPGAASRSN